MSCVEETLQTGPYVWRDARRQQGNTTASSEKSATCWWLLLFLPHSAC